MREICYGILIGAVIGALVVEGNPTAMDCVSKGKKMAKEKIDMIKKKPE